MFVNCCCVKSHIKQHGTANIMYTVKSEIIAMFLLMRIMQPADDRINLTSHSYFQFFPSVISIPSQLLELNAKKYS